MLSEVTTTFNIHDYFGSDFDARRAKAWATNNADGQKIDDTSTGESRIGAGSATIAEDGTGTFTHWAPGVDGNPTSWQTTYHFDVPDRTVRGGRRQKSFGPYTVTTSGLLTALEEEQGIPPTYAGTLIAEMEAIRDDQIQIAGIDDTDSAMAAVIGTAAGPLTQAALAGMPQTFPLARYGTVTAGADHTALLQAAADEARDSSIADGAGVRLLCPPGLVLRSTGINVRGTFQIDLQGGKLLSTAAAGTTPLFTADPDFGCDFQLSNGRVETNNVVVRGQGDPGYAGNIRVWLSRLHIEDAGTPLTANYFEFTSVDFLHIENVVCYGANIALVVDSDDGAGERSCTQLSITEMGVLESRLGAWFRGIDKAEVNIDCSNVGSGIIVSGANNRLTLNRCHVELFGHSSYTYAARDGRGIAIDNSSTQRDIVLNQCSIFLPSTNAIAGMELYGTLSSSDPAMVVYNSCGVAVDLGLASYKPVNFQGPYEWNGRWPFTSDADTHGGRWTDGVIRDHGRTAPRSSNLMRFARLSDPAQVVGTDGAGTFALTSYSGAIPHGRTITLSVSAIARYRSVTLKAGWHTILVHGRSDGDDFYVYAQGGTTFTNFAEARLRCDTTDGQLFRIPFYLPADESVRIGVRSYSMGAAAVLGRWELHRGHVTDFTDNPREALSTAAPTTGVWEVGDKVWNETPAASGAPGWICTTAPTTFKAMANLAA